MNYYLLLVEGIADIIFFRDYLKFLYPELVEKDKNLDLESNKEMTLSSERLEIVILESGGCTKLRLLKTRIQVYMDKYYSILMVQDADNPNKDYGGKEKRIRYLEDQKKELEIHFKTFLFPNNENDGDLETLLVQIAQENKYTDFNDCYNKYLGCLSNFLKSKIVKNLSKEKEYIYTYLSLYQGNRLAKERDREYIIEYWDFDSDSLLRLKGFFYESIFH